MNVAASKRSTPAKRPTAAAAVSFLPACMQAGINLASMRLQPPVPAAAVLFHSAASSVLHARVADLQWRAAHRQHAEEESLNTGAHLGLCHQLVLLPVCSCGMNEQDLVSTKFYYWHPSGFDRCSAVVFLPILQRDVGAAYPHFASSQESTSVSLQR